MFSRKLKVSETTENRFRQRFFDRPFSENFEADCTKKDRLQPF